MGQSLVLLRRLVYFSNTIMVLWELGQIMQGKKPSASLNHLSSIYLPGKSADALGFNGALIIHASWGSSLKSPHLTFLWVKWDNDASLLHRDIWRVHRLKECKALEHYADGSYKSPSDRKTWAVAALWPRWSSFAAITNPAWAQLQLCNYLVSNNPKNF